MKVVNLVIDQMVRRNVIKESDRNIYSYGLTVMVLKLAALVVAVIISIFIGETIDLLIFLLLFIPLRKYAGGFHERTALRCFIESQIILILVEITLKYIHYYTFENIAGAVFSFVGAAVIIYKAPIGSVNRVLNDKQKKKYRKISLVVCLILILIAILTYIYNYMNVTYAVFITFLLEGILLIIPEKKEL